MAQQLTFPALVDAMNHIRASGRQWPEVKLQLASGNQVKLGLSADGMAVIVRDADGDKLAFLRTTTATWTQSLRGSNAAFKASFWALAKALSADPIETFSANGKRLGFCAMCGLPLSADESMERGIGPECWKRLTGG